MPQTPITLSGAAFRDFWKNHWPKGWYVEDLPYTVEDERGNYILPDDAIVRLDELGYAYWEGGKEGKEYCRPQDKSGFGIPMDVFYARVMGNTPAYTVVAFRVSSAQAEELIKAGQDLGAIHIG